MQRLGCFPTQAPTAGDIRSGEENKRVKLYTKKDIMTKHRLIGLLIGAAGVEQVVDLLIVLRTSDLMDQGSNPESDESASLLLFHGDPVFEITFAPKTLTHQAIPLLTDVWKENPDPSIIMLLLEIASVKAHNGITCISKCQS